MIACEQAFLLRQVTHRAKSPHRHKPATENKYWTSCCVSFQVVPLFYGQVACPNPLLSSRCNIGLGALLLDVCIFLKQFVKSQDCLLILED